MIKVELKTAVNVETSIRYDHNQDPAVFKVIKINYKKTRRELVFLCCFFFHYKLLKTASDSYKKKKSEELTSAEAFSSFVFIYLHIFLMVQVGRISLNIKAFHLW